MTEFQEKLLQTFKAFAEFCKKNNLTYYAAYGTCLGAVRHQGFIPWDDDMDVFMMRDDYERLMVLRNQLADTMYRFSDFRDGAHPYTFGKFYSTDCSVWELRQFPFIIGPWIDIFPLDEWNDSARASRLYDDYNYALWKYRKALSKQTWSEILRDFTHLNGFNGPIKLVKKCAFSPFRKFFLSVALALQKQVEEVKGPCYKNWNSPKKRNYNKDWFKSVIELPFEDVTISCPIEYRDYLSYEYGDFMVPPPEDKRSGGHPCYYIDLSNKKTSDEILLELRQDGKLDNNEAKPLKIRVLIDELLHRRGF